MEKRSEIYCVLDVPNSEVVAVGGLKFCNEKLEAVRGGTILPRKEMYAFPVSKRVEYHQVDQKIADSRVGMCSKCGHRELEKSEPFEDSQSEITLTVVCANCCSTWIEKSRLFEVIQDAA